MFFSSNIGLILLIGLSYICIQSVRCYLKSQIVRDAALDVLESLTKLAEVGFMIQKEKRSHFYDLYNGTNDKELPSFGPIPINGRQRECDQSERQVTTVDNNGANVCCVSSSESTSCKKLQCSKVVDNCCLRMGNGVSDTLCTGVEGAQRASLPSSCQQRGQDSTIIVHKRENKVQLCCVNSRGEHTRCGSKLCQSVVGNCCIVKGSGQRLCSTTNTNTAESTVPPAPTTSPNAVHPADCVSSRDVSEQLELMTRSLNILAHELKMRSITHEIQVQRVKAAETTKATTAAVDTTTTTSTTTTTTSTTTDGYESSELETWTWPVPTAPPAERSIFGTDTRENRVPDRSDNGNGQVLPTNVVDSITQIPSRIVSTLRGWTRSIFGPLDNQ